MAMSSPGVKPAFSMAWISSSSGSSLLARLGAKPPSSPTGGGQALVVEELLEVW
jgi:hypothetical protein